MKPPGAVRWSEGMFLRPQHFQQGDLFHAEHSRYLVGVLHPFPWGVRRCSIDTDALENEILRMEECELILPDGLVVRYPQAAESTERSFKDSFAPSMEALGVYVCVHALDERHGGLQRYGTREDASLHQHAASGPHAMPQRLRQAIREAAIQRNRQADIAVMEGSFRHVALLRLSRKPRRVFVRTLAEAATQARAQGNGRFAVLVSKPVGRG